MKKNKYNHYARLYSIMASKLYWLFVVFVLLLGLTVFASIFRIGGIGIYSVLSGSMSPKIFAGSLIIIKSQNNYKEGDIITYNLNKPTFPPNQSTITHRINEVQKNEKSSFFITKGDRNPSNDSSPVSKEQVIGKVILTIPLFGYASSFAKTPLGFIVMILIPCFLILVSELIKISRNLSVFRRKEAI